MCPLHRLDFALRVPVVNPRFVPSNNLPQKLDRVRLKEIYELLRCSDASRTIMICQIPSDLHLQMIMDYGFHISKFPHESCIVLAISSTFILLSSLISFSTAAITDGLTALDGRLDL